MKDLKLKEARTYVKENQHTVKLAGVTALVVAMSAWTSFSALGVTKEARIATDEAVAVRTTATRFSQQFVAASTGETDEWARTTEEAAEFGTAEPLKVSLAQTTSRIAEVAGMSNAKVSFAPAESVAPAGTRTIGDLAFQPASFGLTLEASGTVSSMARVILRLPPATEITSLSLGGGSNELKATFQLAVYQSAGGPQN